jgi:hypothetical protein
MQEAACEADGTLLQLPLEIHHSLSSSPAARQCTTRWDVPGKAVHQGDGTCMVAGYAWCECCTGQQKWMALGQSLGYMRLDFAEEGGPVVQAGEACWLQFAQDAGYQQVDQAVTLLVQLMEST